MKKITLLLLLFCSFLGYGQLETFEGGIPSSWKVLPGVNGLGAGEMWKTSALPNSPYAAYQGAQAAYVNNFNVGEDNIEEDWLITNQRTVPANGQLRFFARQTIASNQFTTLEIRVSRNSVQENQGAYEVVKTFTEGELNNLNGSIEAYREHVIDLDDFIGAAVYVAFVRVYEQTTPARGGDRFLIDNVNILSECGNPTVLSAPFATVYSTSALLDWEHPVGAASFEIEVLEASVNPTGAGISIPPPPYIATNLDPETDYKYYVRTRCLDPEGGYYTSDWVGPFYFTTIPIGSVCADPLVIGNLPYQVTGANTAFYGDQYDAAQGTALCGATPAGTNYLQGNEVFYSFTPVQSGNISIIMTPLGSASTNSSIFVYTGSCTAITSGCVTGLANAGITPRTLNLAVTSGQTYYIVISSAAATPSISYNLLIQQENCLPKPANLTATSPTLVGTNAGITLGWDNPGAYSSFQIEVQTLNSPVPSGPGTDVSATNSFIKTGLSAATQYQFWVRAECTPGSGIFTSWAGPFAFNTQVCDALNTCMYKFRLTDTGTNGWGTNRMVVRQNGIVVFTLGTQIPSGGGPVEVQVPMCPNVPFDLYWSATGTGPGQCGVTILNSFDQVLYTKPTNLSAVNTILFGPEAVKCDAPRCDLIPTNLGATGITTDGATLTWASAPITNYEIYLVPTLGSSAPTASTEPTYTGTSADYTFLIPDPLEADLSYTFYIRTPCSPNDSPWAGPYTFMTLPTCFKPTALLVPPASIGLHNATFDWTNGQPGDNSWEILLIPGPDVPPPPPVNPVLTGGTLLFGTTVDAAFTLPGDPLDNATVYYYYIRTVCPGDDKSRWAGPIKFNTLTCAPADKCNYKFVLTNTNGNSWNGGRMQVMQNGILITTIGSASINNANGVIVGLCPGESFELFWSVAGTAPENIGVSIQNPFRDVIFTKDPAEGTPLTEVYQGTVNCTAAPCSKPTPVTVSNITATTATITWTDVSSPPTSSVDLYVITTGGIVPENDPVTPPTIAGIVGTPVVGSPNMYTYVINTLDGTLPLLPSTSYTFYIRSNCGGTDRSTWTILDPVIFITKPANDLCVDAVAVTPNSGQSCMPVNSVAGNTLSASASDPFTPPLTGAGCGATNRDVWFKFVATSTSHTINLSEVVVTPDSASNTFRLNYSVFSGPCDALVKINCFTNNVGVLTGLTISNTYYIRVYNSTTAANQSAKFKLCITSPPANDECTGALAVGVNPLWNCSAFTTAGNTLGATQSLPTETGAGCTGTDDDVWFKFVATGERHVIYINDIMFPNTQVANGTLNHTLYSGTCDGLTKLYCKNDKQSVATGLTIGNTYYIRIYTPGAVAGQYATFQLCVSTPPAPALNDECIAALPVEVNASTSCDLKTAGLISGATLSIVPNQTPVCQGTADDDVWFSFVPLYTSHIISLEDIEGTITTATPTSTLNYAVYSGSCGGLVRKFCFNGNNNENNYYNYIPGNTYYIRVWSSSPNPEVVKFNVCIKSFPTCDTKAPVCATGVGKIFENTTGFDLGSFDFVDNPVACLTNAPNPVYFTLNVDVTGPLYFDIIQNTDIDNVTGELLGTGMDVDYVCWGPFQQGEEGCEYPFPDCPSCPNNTDNANYYPHGNIMDCSWSINTIETLSLPNAQEGEYYILLITNYDSDPGEIKLVQTNAGDPGAGTVICCGVNLGPDVQKCASSTILDSQLGTNPEAEQPDAGSFKWYKGTDLIVGANQSTLEVFTSGVYRVTADCGLNPEEDTIIVLLSPPIEATTPADYVVCDDATNDGIAPFTLDILQNQMDLADLTLYNFTYHLNPAAANNDDPGITTVSTPTSYASNTMIYIRVESTTLATCYVVIPVKLVVAKLPNPQFDFAAAFYCKNATTPNPLPDTLPETGGTYTVVPAIGLVIDPATGEIDVQASTANDLSNVNDFYTIRYTIPGTPENQCGDVWFEDIVKITAPPVGTFNYTQLRYCTNASDPAPQLATGSVAGVYSTDSPLLLIVDPATGIIDISESTVGGPYIVYNTIDATGASCGIVVAETEVYITTLPLADFTYDNVPVSNSYCQNAANPVLTLGTGAVTGVFSAEPAGLDITAAGVINLATSTPSATPYTVYNKIAALDGCQEATAQYSITVTAPQTADFTYSPTAYCSDSTVNPQPQFIGNASAGVFSSDDPVNLVVNSATGVVDIAASSPGSYTVTNFIADGTCTGDTAIATITIAERKTGTIAYSNGALFCKSTSTTIPVTATVPTGGSYSSSGLSVDASTGTIDVTASNAGTYNVFYTIADQNDGCGIFRAETSVTILPEFALGFETGCEEQKYTVRVIPVDGSFDPLTADYEWSGTGFATTPDANAIILSSKGVVTITVTSDQGCTSVLNFDSTNLNIGCVIQRGISPNNDGDNDFFDLSAYDVKHLGIFNRYGTEVFQRSSYVREWGGQSNSGDELTDGTYFYVIDLADGTNKTGWIYLNR